jgi:arylsulfatase A
VGFCWQSGKHFTARKDDWKLLGYPADNTDKALLTEKNSLLVNLKNDPEEMINVSSKYPEKVKKLKSQFEKWVERNELIVY